MSGTTCDDFCYALSSCICEVRCGNPSCAAPYESLFDIVAADLDADRAEEEAERREIIAGGGW